MVDKALQGLSFALSSLQWEYMRLMSWNVNGIRAVYQKGFYDWLERERPDYLALQEIKASNDNIPSRLWNCLGYESFINSGQKKGYAGVLSYCKERPSSVNYELGLRGFDEEGRFIEMSYHDLTIINLYMVNGGRHKEKFPEKFAAFDRLLYFLKERRQTKLVIMGDFNVAHHEIDLARPKENAKNTGFTNEEREQLDRLEALGYIDTFRYQVKEGGHYTWWSNFSKARQRNVGWRIDYIFISPPLLSSLKGVFILPEIKGSDHCPIGIELKL